MLYINKLIKNQAVDYAAEELKKYIELMTSKGDIEIISNPSVIDGFKLGLMDDFGLDCSDVLDPMLDDVLYIDTDEKGGVIAGSNPRSVLLSVYELLRQNGCRWLFPGKEGEYIPKGTIKPLKYRHKPTSRFRGPCIEGACSQVHILETIDFLPKVGMNLFRSQFDLPTVFYIRYGKNNFSTKRARVEVSRDEVAVWKAEFVSEIKKRGLRFHDMGHGWTVLPFGISRADIWSPEEGVTFPPENLKYMAMLDGERKLNRGKPLVTNICMSNEEAVRRVVNYITEYASAHPETDTLHIALADSHNNHCECPECQKQIPSDFYVTMLNEVDRRFTERGIKTHIVFSAYMDTIYAPVLNKIENPSRFSLSISPITRSYTHTLGDSEEVDFEYRRNDIRTPNTLSGYLAHYKKWREVFDGSCIANEYHFWRNQYLDISGLNIAQRIYDDLKLYESMGINGMIACGSQRSYFPSGLAYYVFARAQFDSSLSFEDIREDYFTYAFGKYKRIAEEYLEGIRRAFPHKYMAAEDSADPSVSLYYNPALYDTLDSAHAVADKLRADLSCGFSSENELVRESLALLLHHADFSCLVADFVKEYCVNNREAAREKYELMKDVMSEKEDVLERYFDHWLGVAYLERIIRTDDKFW